jgi:tRNA(Ile)-lysidine synthase
VIQLQGKLDRHVNIACSGGVDSMAVVDFLSSNHNCTLVFFDHGTETSAEASEFLLDFVSDKNKQYWEHPIATNLTLQIGRLTRTKEKSESWEEFWRNERYRYFHQFSAELITCHHLDDCVETWIWSSLHGEGKIIPYRNKNVVRPFRLNSKVEFVNWCRKRNVPWIEDSSNHDTRFMRNFIRKELVEKCLVVNQGLSKVLRKKVIQDGPKAPTVS